MYNSVYPYNINFQQNRYNAQNSAFRQQKDANEPSEQNINDQKQNSNTFPNGTKVAIDYSKGQINISQVLADFRSTIIAINAPDDIKDEVYQYLNLVEKESLKENPSKEIIVSNLRNASKISDDFIAKSLNKPSNVVEGWIKALFLQNINLKSDPSSINPDFLLNFPQKAQERIDNQKKQELQNTVIQPQNQPQIKNTTAQRQISETPSEAPEESQIKISNNENFKLESSFELSPDQKQIETNQKEPLNEEVISPFGAYNSEDKKAREIFTRAKSLPNTNKGNTTALNLLNEALGIISQNEQSNKNIKAALHIERGKIFDSYDYVDYALRDYFEATKAQEPNLKAQAFYKTAQIYDEFNEFDPALSNYLSSVAYSGEADNIKAQSQALVKIASLYTKQYDIENTSQYQDLALDIAQDSENDEFIAKTHSQSAQNYQYLGENDKAIDGYKNALAYFSRTDESPEEMAYNYEQASIIMDKLGNHAKAQKLQRKAVLYYQKAQLRDSKQAVLN